MPGSQEKLLQEDVYYDNVTFNMAATVQYLRNLMKIKVNKILKWTKKPHTSNNPIGLDDPLNDFVCYGNTWAIGFVVCWHTLLGKLMNML